MNNEDYDYEYDYHNLADNSDELTSDEDYYYADDEANEPWMGMDEDENETMNDIGWENYYHNIADEIADD
jgi:hypothetical protein